MLRYDLLRANALVFIALLIVGLIFIGVGIARISPNNTSINSCSGEDFIIDSTSGSIISAAVYGENTAILNLGNEVLLVNTCNNSIIRRLKFRNS